eukprot:4412706-Amphidinium_carterae.1
MKGCSTSVASAFREHLPKPQPKGLFGSKRCRLCFEVPRLWEGREEHSAREEERIMEMNMASSKMWRESPDPKEEVTSLRSQSYLALSSTDIDAQ